MKNPVKMIQGKSLENKIINNLIYYRKFVIFAIFLIFSLLINFGYRINSDEGQILSGGWNIYNGEIIYEDFFEFIGPASFYFTALSYRLLGPQYSSALIFASILLCISAYLFSEIFYSLSQKEIFSYIIGFLYIIFASISYPLINHNSLSSFIIVIACYYAMRFFDQKEIKDILFFGSFIAIAFYFLQTKGLAVLFFITVFFIYQLKKKSIQRQHIIFFYVGWVICFLIGAILWQMNPLLSALTVASGNISMTFIHLSFFTYALYLGIFLLLIRIFAMQKKIDQKILCIMCIQSALLLSTLNFPDQGHTQINSFFIFLLMGILLVPVWGKIIKNIVFKIVVCAPLCIVLITILYNHISHNIDGAYENLSGIEVVKQKIGGEKIFAYPFIPNFYFELKKDNPYYNDVLFEKNNPPEHFQKNLEILKREKPRYILTNYVIVKKYNHTFQNPIDRYIREAYEKKEDVRSVDIWEIKDTNKQ